MTPAHFFLSAWEIRPSVAIGCALSGALYLRLGGRLLSRAGLLYFAGNLVLFAALCSPLDALGDDYLFSAHMLQHMLLILAVPLLFLLGLTREQFREAFRHRWARRAWARLHGLERKLTSPPAAWLIANGTLWAWHLPYLYNLALDDEGWHAFEHFTFLVTWAIFWWPVLSPLSGTRFPPLVALFYLLAAAVSNSLLGIWLTFLPPGLYPTYLEAHDPFAIRPWLVGDWGLTPAADEQLGGLLMWVAGSVVFLAVILGVLGRWYALELGPRAAGQAGGTR